MAKKKEEKKAEMTRAQKTEATKGIIKELLSIKPMRHNELIEETAKLYTERYKSEETENVNDVKGRAGSVLDIMKKESEVMYEGGMYALKARMPMPAPEETKVKKTAKTKTKKAEPKAEEKKEEPKEEQPAPKKRGRAKKTEEKTEPIKAEESLPVVEDKKEEPKKRGRKPKAKTEETTKVEEPTPVVEEKKETPVQEKKEEVLAPQKEEVKEEPTTPQKAEEPKKEETALTVKPKAEVAQKNVMDMSFLIGVKEKPQKAEPVKTEEKEEKKAPVSAVKVETPKKAEEKKEVKTEEKPQQKPTPKVENKPQKTETKPTAKQPQKTDVRAKQKQPSSEEKLRETFLKRMRALGGDYFEYYSVYLLERYSMKNGRRLEGMKISGGERDGGIDGEIELTDKFGFRETIYIQSKNWDPDKGKEENWVVGETLLQQFIGACACRQAKDGKQHCRGIFVTTSRFTPDAKRILEDMSDKIVGYDGNDLYETAKECEFGIVKKNGEWALDEKLLSGTKAFFNML
ncbi:MAG: restriction endonuclease [Clostridia bacterium]|nr:restriction endonuclease [Clostridia bacterium]